MPAGHQLSSAVLVLSTAAVSCGLTALAAVYLLPRYQQNIAELHRKRHQQNVAGCKQTTAGTHKAAACDTPEPCVSGVPVQQQWQQQQQQQQQQTPDMALFSPINHQKRPDPYDVRPRANYLSWDDYFMAIAFLSAERSKDPNKQVGACIVNDDNIILSIGYNGFPRGCADRSLPWAKKAASGSILDTKYPYVVHAEANALLNKNQATVSGARIYVTLFPCNECAKLLIQAGIREVVYHEAKLEPTGKRPGTMENAAAADALEDAAAAAAAEQCGSVSHACGLSSCTSDSGTSADETKSSGGNADQKDAGSLNKQQKQGVFSVGSSADLDASYVASQRLLTMAGVRLRQHRLQHSIRLGPVGRSS